MGVPKMFLWLLKKYKKSNFVFQNETTKLEDIDWFMIDANGLCHPKAFEILAEEQIDKGENINFKSLQNKMINAIILYIEKLIDYVDPKVGVYIAIDGPVCLAKIKQQRQRRFRSVHDKILFDKIKTKHKKPIPYYWNNSAISPGTKFMDKLHLKILNFINEYKLKKNIKIIYSSSNIPGEGEHKLLEYIKEHKNNNYSYVTYGLDADLIFLMFVTQSDKVYLLREAQQFEASSSKDQLNFVSIKIMKECILDTFENYINSEEDEIKFKLDKNRIINDFVFLCYFLGNDFLPHILALDISKNGIEYLIEKYAMTFIMKNDYILSENTKMINQTFLQDFLKELSLDENLILTENYGVNKRKPRYQGNDEYEKELFKIENLLFKVNDPIGIGEDLNYRENYYKYYFDVEYNELESFVEKLVKNYLIGIRWVTHYYFEKIIDFNWYYPYDNPPFLCDIYKYLINMDTIKFDETSLPMTPFEQLLIILPPQSKYLLPTCLAKLVSSPQSSLAHLYPIDFEIYFLYKRRYWEGIPRLPGLECKLTKYIYKKYKNELTDDEKYRNRLDEIILI
jgi:5'-3' exonuclease